MPTKLLHLYIRVTDEQHRKVSAVAAEKDRPIAWVVRSLIDRLETPKGETK